MPFQAAWHLGFCEGSRRNHGWRNDEYSDGIGVHDPGAQDSAYPALWPCEFGPDSLDSLTGGRTTASVSGRGSSLAHPVGNRIPPRLAKPKRLDPLRSAIRRCNPIPHTERITPRAVEVGTGNAALGSLAVWHSIPRPKAKLLRVFKRTSR